MAGLWLEGTTRVGPGEIAEAIRSELLVPKGWVHPEKDRLRSW